MGFNLYGISILTAVIVGTAAADILGSRCGIRRRTLFYTSFFIIFSVIIFAIAFSFVTSGGSYIGLSGLGGALGLMIGTIFSSYVHEDHPTELFASWVVSAPLMYSVSKLGCLYAGCCSGDFFGVPVQLIDSIAFMIIFIISLIVFIRADNKVRAAYTAMVSAFAARFMTDFFRDSHSGKVISSEQICVLVAGCTALLLYVLKDKLPLPKDNTGDERPVSCV